MIGCSRAFERSSKPDRVFVKAFCGIGKRVFKKRTSPQYLVVSRFIASGLFVLYVYDMWLVVVR